LHEKIDAADFKIMKVESEKEINLLESKIIQLPNDTRTIENITRRGMDNLISLDERFEKGTVKEQREIVGSIYPENLTFDGEHYRTARLNEAVRQIYLIEKELQENKNGTSEGNFDLCRKAEKAGLPPLHYADPDGGRPDQIDARSLRELPFLFSASGSSKLRTSASTPLKPRS
jgi:hypothetical protein